MNHWSPKLALFAYVIGGWLLPHAHHHDHACAHHSGPNALEHRCCHHSAPDEDHGQAGDELCLINVDETLDAGLCALCAARSLAKFKGGKMDSGPSNSHCETLSGSAICLYLGRQSRANQTRGPPLS